MSRFGLKITFIYKHVLKFHISGQFGGISRYLRGASFKIFSNHGVIKPKFKLLGEEIRYVCGGGISKEFPPKY